MRLLPLLLLTALAIRADEKALLRKIDSLEKANARLEARLASHDDAENRPPGPSMALLWVATFPPRADVLVDDVFRGTSPILRREVAAGRHRLTALHPLMMRRDTTVEVASGEEKKINWNLE